ncbi:MAG: adenine phosphoribosyltransferase [Bacilli bacterium]|nr:adenine phosphoribosyltransferase [Bacilli bacterium]
MKILKNRMKNKLNIRTEKDFPKKGIEFIDITPLFLQKETLKEMQDLFKKEIKKQEVDYIVGPEARGFLLGSMLATALGVGFIPVRKKGKLPPTTVAATANYTKEYGDDVLELPKLVKGSYKNKKFYLVDDIYATGNTMTAIKNCIEEQGGKVVGEGVIINIQELNEKKDLFSLIDINEE